MNMDKEEKIEDKGKLPKVHKKKKNKFSKKQLEKFQNQIKSKNAEEERKQQLLDLKPAPIIAKRAIIFYVFIMALLILFLLSINRDVSQKQFPRVQANPTEVIPVGDNAVLLQGFEEAPYALWADPSVLDSTAHLALEVQKQLVKDSLLPVETVNSFDMHFRLIPYAGPFGMGSPELEKGRELDESLHTQQVRFPFYLGKYEVSQKQFLAVMGYNPGNPSSLFLPVNEVSWFEAMAFCDRMSEMEGLPKGSYRLPTEIEWEYACRSMSDSAYYFGDEKRINESRYYSVINEGKPSVSGTRIPNAWGLHNMHGNMWEWCRNWFYDYDTQKVVTWEQYPIGIYFQRSVRGGNYFSNIEGARSASRYTLTDRSKGNYLGFRVLRVFPKEMLHKKERRF